MPDATQTQAEKPAEAAAPAAPSIDMAAITKTVTELQSLLAETQKNQKVLADTIAATAPIDPAKLKADAEAAAVAAVEVKQKAAADEAANAAKAQSDRAALLDKISKEKLGGDVELAGLLSGDTEAALVASAEKLAAKMKSIKPDFGGAAKDGGTPPSGVTSDRSFGSLLK